MYIGCPLSFLYYKNGVEGEKDMRYMVTGSAVHRGIQMLYDPGAKAEEIDETLVLKSRYFDAMAGYDMLVVGHPTLKPSDKWIAETTLTRDLDGVTILGRIDLMTKDGKKIIDWKTGARTEKDVMQGRIYKWLSAGAHRLHTDQIDVRLAYLREHPVGYVSVPYTSDDAVKNILSEVIEKIRMGRYEGKKGKKCSQCEYRRICEEWN